MIAEWGHVALILALAISVLTAIIPLVGASKGWNNWMQLARPLSQMQFVLVALAFAALCYAFLQDDFTISYVAQNSNSKLPWFYKLSAVWGAHEGSLLLWILMLTGWQGAVSIFSRGLPLIAVARVLAVMGMISFGFLAFIQFTSNPFETLLPFYPVDGRDLNPLLQDIGLIMHPPMLYMGYVGFAVAFAFAIAALLSGQLDAAWARWSRPWTMAAWISLTIGIALGSWWAYYELGWGGWWFWDPVENASFMPWLAGTALIHSLAVCEKRGVFKLWTVLLALSAFSLSLLGTFLVRSGVLVSVHAFASDPSRGLFILAFLFIVIGGSLSLFAWRGAAIKSRGKYEVVSRETMLIGNNLLLVTSTLVVLIGTIWPLIHKELGWGTISVGPPFFNLLFSILIVPFVFLLGVGPLSRWRRQSGSQLRNRLLFAGGLSVTAGLGLNAMFGRVEEFHAALGIILGLWVVICTIQELLTHQKGNMSLFKALSKLTRSHWAMVIGHLGFAVSIVGIALTSAYTTEHDVRMQPGDVEPMASYTVRFDETYELDGPNYRGTAGEFSVFDGDRLVTTLHAEKRQYLASGSIMTEAAIDAGLFRDLFIALGEPLGGDAWAVRLHYKPFIRWIWLGALIMSFAGCLAIADKRYRLARRQPEDEPVAQPVEAPNS
ncbi:heme lyase CcmF/NrfE family subunit [Echinimonas agarilytica]|uniref:Heme lyase CcmF/NrfE family subunit n=1 Tax=Echinimonas agarilytica TaxID=1215918 RepID=A0AA41W5Q6_9GAMM|nr:heme lyase CcmF/NrfE family subunit [Echinimonas agarilytica]MCM2679003.1 heme lyase CcmF/NrfE family subunit [Echinimonas agarilytica]